MANQPGPLVSRWEALPGPLRFLITFVVLAPIFFVGHNSLGTMSTKLAAGYGVMWGAIFSLLGLWATRTEQFKRLQREHEAEPPAE